MKKMKLFIIWGRLLVISFILTFYLYGEQSLKPDEVALREIKLLFLDEKWTEVVQRLDDFLQRYPSSPLYRQAVFMRARSLAQLPGRTEEALKAYESFLEIKSVSPGLAEEAELAIINLAGILVNQGKREYVTKIESRLRSPNKVVRYYAAFKMSYFKEKSLAEKSIPVLKEIISEEKDAELCDRARVALLRVSPRDLSELEERSQVEKPLVLKIKVEKKGKKEPEIFISIPWSLADLALRSIPERDRERLRHQGYDVERIIRDLSRTKGKIIEIDSEDTIIKIWLERD